MANGVYRDGTEGAAARRQDLLQRRRAELVTMPHAVRRVVVARAARIAAGKAIAIGGVVLVGVAAWPSVAAWLASVLPGVAPAPLATILTATWVVGVVAWAMSAARSQHRFVVAMSRYVLPSEDLDHDVERLDHEHPDDMARTMGHRLEVGSAAWPVVAAGAIVPATMLWLSMLVTDRSYVPVSALEVAIALDAWMLGAFAIAGGLAAIVMTRRAARKPLVATMLAPVAVVACGFAGYAIGTSMNGAWIYGSVAAIVAVGAIVVRRLRRERALIDVADPAAGSELFTIRGAIRELRAGFARMVAGLAAVRARMRGTRRGTRIAMAAIVAVAAVAVAAGVSYRRFAQRVDLPMASVSPSPGVIAVPSGPAHQPSSPDEPLPARLDAHVESRGGVLWYDVPLDARGTASIPLVGFRMLPQGWQADLAIKLISPSLGDRVRLQIGGESLDLDVESSASKLMVDGCAAALPMTINVVAPAMAGKQVSLSIMPVVHLGACPLAVNR